MEIKNVPFKPLPSNSRVEGQLTVPFPLAITPLLSVSAQRISSSEKNVSRRKIFSDRVTLNNSQRDLLHRLTQTGYNTFDSVGPSLGQIRATRDACDSSAPSGAQGLANQEEQFSQPATEVLSVGSDSDDSVFAWDDDDECSNCSSGYDTRQSSAYPTPLPTLQMHGRFTRELKQYAKAEAARIRAEKERQREVEDEFRRYQENTICHRIKGIVQ
ncbi:hypothetical protein BSL78_08213 [Apostichopus japonicus]|uniref:Uncharacterized protein n=1 Tax=Stichopus japonicus TaxID=307972 RepID=A0A2G8L3N8_STIJA|nr:hypothetical protein BSL78_08213 [Apostichopus japonicus]